MESEGGHVWCLAICILEEFKYKDLSVMLYPDQGGRIRSGSRSSQRKAKTVWTSSLHNRFLEAIRCIGYDRAVPRKILEVMNIKGLSRENVASHLQKYRIYLRRLSNASYKLQNSADRHILAGRDLVTASSSPHNFPFQYFPSFLGSPSSSLVTPNVLAPSNYVGYNVSNLKHLIGESCNNGGCANIAKARIDPFLVGDDINRDGGLLSDVVRDYRVMQPTLNPSPPFDNVGNRGGLHHESVYSPTFEIQHLEAFSKSRQSLDQGGFHNTYADETSILNQNGGEPITSYWDHICHPSFDQNLIARPQEVRASSSAQLNNAMPSTPASECEEEEFLNSLLASYEDRDDDITLDGI